MINSKKDSQELNTILNEWDFLHVVPAGVNDEYTDLLDPLLNLLYEKTDAKGIFQLLKTELLGRYGLDNLPSTTKDVSEKIFYWWKRKLIYLF